MLCTSPIEQDLETLTHDAEMRRGIIAGVNAMHQIPASFEKHRQGMVAEARRGELWEPFVFLHPCEMWLDVFEANVGNMRDEVYWSLLLKIYNRLDGVVGEQDRFLRLFLAPGRSREHAIDAWSRGFLERRPDPCMLYRGCAGVFWPYLSWSLSRRATLFFAYRASERLNDPECPPVVIVGTAFKKDILAMISKDDLAEVIISPECVSEVRRHTLLRLQQPISCYM